MERADNKAAISCLVPTYNNGRFLKASLESILRQTYRPVELVIIDDGSTDDTRQIVSALQPGDIAIRYVYQQNCGIVDALNKGLELCSGEFIARHDGDDIAHPTRFERQARFLQERPQCLATSGGFHQVDGDGRFTAIKQMPGTLGNVDFTWLPAREPYLPHSFLMMRADIMKRLRYRYVHHAEDADLYWRATEYGDLLNQNEVMGVYRIHTSSVSGKSVVEGRIQAIFSQLAAISAQRRAKSEPDIDFCREWLAECRRRSSLIKMIELVEDKLSASERTHLRRASVLKLLEFSAYRPYKVDAADVAVMLREKIPRTDVRVQNKREIRKRLKTFYRHTYWAGGLRFRLKELFNPTFVGPRPRA